MVTAKRLALVLMAGNAIFFLWAEFGHQTGPNLSPGGVIAPVERLVLLDELPRPSGPEAPGAAGRTLGTGAAPGMPQEAAVQPSPQCYRIGPFADRKAAAEFAGRQGVSDRIEAESYSRVVGYWIMYPPAETLAVSRRNLERLKAEGWQDLWLFERGPWQGAISLGMYAEQNRAEAIAKRLRERGLEVKVVPRQQTLTSYWVRFERGLSEAGQEVPAELKAVPCPVRSGSEAPTSAGPTLPEAAGRQ